MIKAPARLNNKWDCLKAVLFFSDIPFMTKRIFISALVFSALILTSCVTTSKVQNQGESHISRNLTDRGIKSSSSLYRFFMANNPKANKSMVKRMAKYYVEEAAAEGINSDCAFVQMCLETGFLTFGGLVTPQMHNYCGLGSMDSAHPGESFKTERLGVRAHIQHLHAYSTTEENKLKNECIDRRYRYVNPRGKAPTIYELAGTWAMDKDYAVKLNGLLNKLESF